jgi:hypothetical protein
MNGPSLTTWALNGRKASLGYKWKRRQERLVRMESQQYLKYEQNLNHTLTFKMKEAWARECRQPLETENESSSIISKIVRALVLQKQQSSVTTWLGLETYSFQFPSMNTTGPHFDFDLVDLGAEMWASKYVVSSC